MSASPVFPGVDCTHAPLFRAIFGMEWGFSHRCGSLVLPLGMSFTHEILLLINSFNKACSNIAASYLKVGNEPMGSIHFHTT